MNTNPVGWFEIYVQDMERAKAFYEAVFQGNSNVLPPVLHPGLELEMWAFPMSQEGYGAGGVLVKMEGGPSGGNTTLVYFKCEDCAVEAARAAATRRARCQGKNVHRQIRVHGPGFRYRGDHDRTAFHALRLAEGSSGACGSNGMGAIPIIATG